MPNPVEYLHEQMITRHQQREQRAHRGYAEILSTDSMGALNRDLVLSCIRRDGPISQAEIANRLHLSRSAVSHIVGFFKEKDLVEEGNLQPVTSRGGKPANEIRFKANAAYIIGVDIGRSHLTVLLRDLDARGPDGKPPWTIPYETTYDDLAHHDPWLLSPNAFATGDGAESCLRDIANKLWKLVEDNSLGWENILGIGIGLPGTLDRNRERLTRALMMPGWNDINIPVILRHFLKVPGPSPIPIYVDNEANLGALGECRYGAGRKWRNSNVLYVKVGTGVGAGIILDGKILRGSGGSAGEFGHQIIDRDGPLCSGCGHHGCLESFVAEHAILRDAGLAKEGTSIKNVVQCAKEGNEQCQAVLRRAGERVGLAIANYINVINPELVLLEGSVVREAGELFMEPLLTSASLHVPAARGTADIRKGDLGKYAIAYGAIASVVDEAFPDEGFFR